MRVTKCIVAALALLTLTFFTLPAALSQADAGKPLRVKITTGNQVSWLKDPAVIIDGRTMAPVRFFIEEIGGKVIWDGQKESVAMLAGKSTIELFIGRKTMVVDGVETQLDVAPKLIDGRTFVPLRALCENIGCRVNWNEDERTVEIMLNDKTSMEYSKADTSHLSNENNAFHTHSTRYKDDVISFFWGNYDEFQKIKDIAYSFGAKTAIGDHGPTRKLIVYNSSWATLPVEENIFNTLKKFWEKFDYLLIDGCIHDDIIFYTTVDGTQPKGIFYTTLSRSEINDIYRNFVDYIEYICEGWYYFVEAART